VPAIRWSQLQERLERAGRGEAQTPTCVVTGCPFWEGGPCGSRMTRAYSRPASTFFIASSNFLMSAGDNCGRSTVIVSLLSLAVSGNGGL